MPYSPDLAKQRFDDDMELWESVTAWLKSQAAEFYNAEISKLIHCYDKTSKKLEAKERCRISANWRYGCYREKGYNTHVRYMPWLYLQSRVLWISQGSNILAVKRLPEGLKMDSPLMNLKMGHKEDISRFVVTDDMIYSASSDKNIYGWSISTERPRPVFCLKAIHSQSILGIDCKRNILVSGSKDSTIKIWQLQETGSPNCTQTVNVSDRVWCVAVNPSLASIAVGSAGYNSVHPIQLYDTERYSIPTCCDSHLSLQSRTPVAYITFSTNCCFLTIVKDSLSSTTNMWLSLSWNIIK
ncbi:F-box/WD repeat-containing protein 4 [Homalodisca vitripennis]|nr:F-box/WD repeat-containing protein 4 [Homalodisca vitripennis]